MTISLSLAATRVPPTGTRALSSGVTVTLAPAGSPPGSPSARRCMTGSGFASRAMAKASSGVVGTGLPWPIALTRSYHPGSGASMPSIASTSSGQFLRSR